jgi:hypothetical protein
MATSNEQITDSEHNWLVKQGFDPNTARWKFWFKNFINRRDYDSAPPPGVLEERRKVDLYKMAEQVNRIEKNTKSFAKVWRDLFRKGAGDIDEHVLK